jgi:hypothetical protein
MLCLLESITRTCTSFRLFLSVCFLSLVQCHVSERPYAACLLVVLVWMISLLALLLFLLPHDGSLSFSRSFRSTSAHTHLLTYLLAFCSAFRFPLLPHDIHTNKNRKNVFPVLVPSKMDTMPMLNYIVPKIRKHECPITNPWSMPITT